MTTVNRRERLRDAPIGGAAEIRATALLSHDIPYGTVAFRAMSNKRTGSTRSTFSPTVSLNPSFSYAKYYLIYNGRGSRRMFNRRRWSGEKQLH